MSGVCQEFGGAVDFLRLRCSWPRSSTSCEAGEIETNSSRAETFDESMQLVAEIVEA